MRPAVLLAILVFAAILIACSTSPITVGESATSPDVEATVSAAVEKALSEKTVEEASAFEIASDGNGLPSRVNIRDSSLYRALVRYFGPEIAEAYARGEISDERAALLVADAQAKLVATATPVTQETPTPQLALSLSRLVENVRPSIVQVETTDGSGTGFVIHDSGLILTNAHVIGFNPNFPSRIVVRYPGSSQEYRVSSIRAYDAAIDMTVLKIDGGPSVLALKFAELGLNREGDEAIAIGYPLTYTLGTDITVTRGIISANRQYNGVYYVQTDASVNPGNSGGPLFNSDGLVIGVVTSRWEFLGGRPVENVAFAVSNMSLFQALDQAQIPYDKVAVTSIDNSPRPTIVLPTPTPSPLPTSTPVPTPTRTPTPTPQTVFPGPRTYKIWEYVIDYPSGWTLNEANVSRTDIVLRSSDGTAVLNIFRLSLPGYSLTRFYGEVNEYRKSSSEAGGWTFEFGAAINHDVPPDGYGIRFDWTRTNHPEFCNVRATEVIILKGPVGFELIGQVCEEFEEDYWDSLVAIIESFRFE